MLGGIAQAEVNDQLKDLDDSPETHSNKFPANWKSFSPNQLGAFTSNSPIYQVYGQQENGQRQKKNTGQTANHGSSNGNHINKQQQQQKYPLVGSLLNYNKIKNQQNSKQKSGNKKNQQNYSISDYSGWSQSLNNNSKKQRTEPQASASNAQFVLRPVLRNKQARDEQQKLHHKGAINRSRHPQIATEMRPPPALKPKSHLILKKVV
jgi:hypothetical protein